jgi:chaperonin GroEL (HSP60 family)
MVVKMLFHQYRETGDKTVSKVIFSPADLEFAERREYERLCHPMLPH